jgi:hypothetical protein
MGLLINSPMYAYQLIASSLASLNDRLEAT